MGEKDTEQVNQQISRNQHTGKQLIEAGTECSGPLAAPGAATMRFECLILTALCDLHLGALLTSRLFVLVRGMKSQVTLIRHCPLRAEKGSQY